MGYPSSSYVIYLNPNQSVYKFQHIPTREKGKKREEMDRKTQRVKSRVVKVESEDSWDFFITQANNQGSPVSLFFLPSFKPVFACLLLY